jgi:plastocyanin
MTNLQKTLAVIAGAMLLMGAGCSNPMAITPMPQTPQPNNTGAAPNKTTVKPSTLPINYSNGEFSPKSIIIKVGDTIIFENMGNDATTTFKGDVATYVPGGTGPDVWPAADPHPTHTSVPGFDAKKGLKVGESYSFTFTKAQTVGYHNHLNPSQTGAIIVK